ncbi:hypothetical protein ACFLTP_01865 [Chloroflexota bacterium]
MSKNANKVTAFMLTATLLASLMVGLLAVPVMGAKDVAVVIENGPGPWVRAIDGTFYTYARIDGVDKVLKSKNARSWFSTAYAGNPVVDIVASGLDRNIVYVVDTAGDIWKTSNAGNNWDNLIPLDNPISNHGNITSLVVGYIDDDPFLFASTVGNGTNTIGGVFVLPEAELAADWIDSNLAGDHGLAATDVEVWDVALSPNFGVDQMVIAAFVDKTANKTFVTTQYGGSLWSAYMEDAELQYTTIGDDLSFTATSAVIWIPEDFDSDKSSGRMEYFIGVTAATSGGDVYRVVTNQAFDRNIGGVFSDTNAVGLDGVGEIGHIALLAGTDSGRIYRSINYDWTWTRDQAPPTGGDNAYPILADKFAKNGKAWAAVDGDSSEGAVSLSRDGGENWKQIFPR